MVELTKPQKGDTVLDVVGPGIMACELANFVSHVTRIDITSEHDKVDEYNKVEKLRDRSHVKAFTFRVNESDRRIRIGQFGN